MNWLEPALKIAELAHAEREQMTKQALRDVKRMAEFPNRSAGQLRRYEKQKERDYG